MTETPRAQLNRRVGAWAATVLAIALATVAGRTLRNYLVAGGITALLASSMVTLGLASATIPAGSTAGLGAGMWFTMGALTMFVIALIVLVVPVDSAEGFEAKVRADIAADGADQGANGTPAS